MFPSPYPEAIFVVPLPNGQNFVPWAALRAVPTYNVWDVLFFVCLGEDSAVGIYEPRKKRCSPSWNQHHFANAAVGKITFREPSCHRRKARIGGAPCSDRAKSMRIASRTKKLPCKCPFRLFSKENQKTLRQKDISLV